MLALLAGLAAGPSSHAEVTLAKRQSLVKGLLIAEVAGDMVGKASQMNATAVPASSGPSQLSFNQDVGDDMRKALDEVKKFLTVRHNGWPEGQKIEIAFEEKYGPKDGPSAAVACALLLDSLVTGNDIDKALAVTGDLNADGSVQPVGGVADKIRGAAQRECRLVAVPLKCRSQVLDASLLDGVKPLLQIQIFSIGTFEEALRLAQAKKDEVLAKIMEDFDKYREVVLRQPNPAQAIRHPSSIAKLRSIVQAMPTHLSAAALLAHATDKAPRQLSAAGSLAAIEKGAALIMDAARSPAGDAFAKDSMYEAVGRLRKVRPILDRRVQHYADSLVQLGEEVRQFKINTPRSGAEQQKAVTRIITKANAVDAEVARIRADKGIMEELIQ